MALREMVDAIARQPGKWLHERSVKHRLRVRYAETDQDRIVYHANYLVWFHEARDAAIRFWCAQQAHRAGEFGDVILKLGRHGNAPGHDVLEETGYRFRIIETRCRHIEPARFGDEVDVTVVPQQTNVAKLMFQFGVHRVRDRHRLAVGQTSTAILGKDNRMLIRLPPLLKQILFGTG